MKIENQITYITGAMKYWLKYHLRAYMLRTVDNKSKDYKNIRKMHIADEGEEKLLGKDFIAKRNSYF